MRKYLKILIGLLRLLKEELMNCFRIKIHGFHYCINSGVKFWVHSGGECDLGKKTWISENSVFESSGGKLHLGYNNFFNTNCRITAINSVEIGDNNLFGPNVIIVDHDHDFSKKNTLICKQGLVSAPVTLGSNIWIGGNVTICKGVTICDGAVIGANSVVCRNIEKPGVYAGTPAILIRPFDTEL